MVPSVDFILLDFLLIFKVMQGLCIGGTWKCDCDCVLHIFIYLFHIAVVLTVDMSS